VTYRIDEPAIAASRIDFSIDSANGRWQATPLEQIANMLTEAAQQQALGLLSTMRLSAALAEGVSAVRSHIEVGLAADQRLQQTGIRVIGVRVVAIRPEPEVERALQTPAREGVQQDADKATFERRALAVERERAISENEMQNQIELARREEQLVTQRGANARRDAEEKAAAGQISMEADAAREQRLAEARAHGIRVVGEAEGSAETARLAAYRDLQDGVLLGLALREFAGNLPNIGNLILTPDLLAPVLARLGAPATTTATAVQPAGQQP
jgi:hypothetical protein